MTQLTWQEYDAISAVTTGVDQVAREMEDRWGVGRLELLVDDRWREKFRRQLRRFDRAIVSNDVERVRTTGEATKRAWHVLDRMAKLDGKKQLDEIADVWEVRLKDGRVVAFCRTNAEAHAEVRSGRYVETWTVDEIARVISSFPDIAKVKQVFPGALVDDIRAKQPDMPDEAEEEFV